MQYPLPALQAFWRAEDQIADHIALLRSAIAPQPLKRPLRISLPEHMQPDWQAWYIGQEFEGLEGLER